MQEKTSVGRAVLGGLRRYSLGGGSMSLQGLALRVLSLARFPVALSFPGLLEDVDPSALLWLPLSPCLPHHHGLSLSGTVAKRGQSKTRKNVRTDKGCRHGRKNVEETQNILQPFQTPVDSSLRDVTPHPFWNTSEKLKQLPLSQLLSYLKVLESLMWQKCNRFFSDMSSVLSESVVASAWVSKSSSSVRTRTVSTPDASGSFPTQQQAHGPPLQLSCVQSLPHQFKTPNLTGGTEAHTHADHPWSTTSQTPSSESSIYGITYRTTEMSAQTFLPTEKQMWKKRVTWKKALCSDNQKYQVSIDQPTCNIPRGTQSTEIIRSLSVFPEHSKILPYHEEDQENQERMTVDEKQPGIPFRFRPSQELTHSQENFPGNNLCQSKNRPELFQPALPYILDSEGCKFSKMMGSMHSRIPLTEGLVNVNMHGPIMQDQVVGSKDLPWASKSTSGKGQNPINPTLWIDQPSYINISQDPFIPEPKTHMRFKSDTIQCPVKHRWEPHSQTLESRDLTIGEVPASFLPQPTYPPSTTGVSKADYYPKAATILENLHQRDPGGKKIQTASVPSLQSHLSVHSPSESHETQRTASSTASRGPSRAPTAAWQSYRSTQAHAYCLLARTQKNRTILGTGRGSVQPSTSSRITSHEPWGGPENVASGESFWSRKILELQEQAPPLVDKQTDQSAEVKQNSPFVWKVTLESVQLPIEQTINIHVSNLPSVRASRSPGLSKTYSPQHSDNPAQMAHVFEEAEVEPNKQPKACPVGLPAACTSTMHPAPVGLSSQNSLPSYQKREKNMSLQGLSDHRRQDRRQEPIEPTVTKHKIPRRKHRVFDPNEERRAFMRSKAGSQGERLGRERSSQAWDLNTSKFKDTATTESNSSLNKLEKEQTLTKSFLKKIVSTVLRYLNLSERDEGKEDSLKDRELSSSPSPTNVQTQMSVGTQNLISSVVSEAHSLINVVVQIVVEKLGLQVGEPSVQWQKVEPHTSKLSNFSHSHEGHYDPEESRLRRKSHAPHRHPKGHNHPSRYRGIRDKQRSDVALTACDQHQRRLKKGLDGDQLPGPKGGSHAFVYKGMGEKQQSGSGDQALCDLHQVRMNSGMHCAPHRHPKGHNHPSGYRGIRDKQWSLSACDQHQRRLKRGMDCDQLPSPKGGSHAFVCRGIRDKHHWQSNIAAQRACDPNQSVKRGLGCGSPVSSKRNSHSFMFREARDKEQSGITAPRACVL